MTQPYSMSAVRQAHIQRGLTLVEIMIAMTLGLILTAGLIQFFIGNKQTQEVLYSINGLQENGRYAMRVIGESIHFADHWGGVEADNVSSGGPAVTGIGNCDASWILDTVGIMGYEGAAASPLPIGCINTNNYLPLSDIVVVRYASGELTPASTVNASGSSIWVNSRIGLNGTITNGSSVGTTDVVGLHHFPFRLDAYYVRPCSNPSGSSNTVCTTTDDNGSPIPTLVRLTLNGNSMVEQALVPGVEQLQFEYGIDSNNDSNADYYVAAASIPASDWDNVTSVRIGLLVRADTRGTLTDANSYDMPGGFTYTPSTADQTYSRKYFSKIIQIRNRTRS